MRFTRLVVAAVAAAASLSAGGGTASALGAAPCPSGYYGVIVEHNGQYTTVCTNLAHVESCPNGDGVVVWVSGRYVSACLRQIITAR